MWQPVQTPCSRQPTHASPLLLKRRSNWSSKSRRFGRKRFPVGFSSAAEFHAFDLVSRSAIAARCFLSLPARFIGPLRVRLVLVGLDHQFEFLILEFADFIFVPLNFVANRLKLLILPGLILLRFETRDAFGACAHVEFQFLRSTST
jgi:hypothetical protein